MMIGVIALARPTFDVEYASETARIAVENLEAGGHDVVGGPGLRMDNQSVEAALADIEHAAVEALVVLQATFTDSSLPVAATRFGTAPAVLWGFPEERTGGRLRLNSFCGINLAGYTLTRIARPYRWLYMEADDPLAADEIAVLTHEGYRQAHTGDVPDLASSGELAVSTARRVRARLDTTVIGLVGQRPDGFEPCGYEPGPLRATLGVRVQEVPLPALFTKASEASAAEVGAARGRAAAFLAGIDLVDQDELDQSMRLNAGLVSLIEDNGWDGVATRCWPETFTDFGGAACTPMALLGNDGTPGSCEADVYGNITALVLQWFGGSPAFVADLVHLDHHTNTGVFWHCGLAPFEMADPETVPIATVHSNRHKPLLSEFPLKPGRVTLARFSQSRGMLRLVIGTAEMVRAPLAFSGTAGVARFDSPVATVVDTVLGQGLEHHFGLVYADVTAELRALAGLLDIPVVEL